MSTENIGRPPGSPEFNIVLGLLEANVVGVAYQKYFAATGSMLMSLIQVLLEHDINAAGKILHLKFLHDLINMIRRRRVYNSCTAHNQNVVVQTKNH